uniref:Uncharacterized protein n=1 Tax=Oryza barthii TaxID=65489 RepID=A0A0D3HQX0_9ORYZ
MPSFPPLGGVTVCEINRDLVVADALSDDRAKEAYGDVLGMVFSPIPFQLDALVANHEPPAVNEAEIVPGQGSIALFLVVRGPPGPPSTSAGGHFIYRRREIQSSTQQGATLVEQRGTHI